MNDIWKKRIDKIREKLTIVYTPVMYIGFILFGFVVGASFYIAQCKG